MGQHSPRAHVCVCTHCGLRTAPRRWQLMFVTDKVNLHFLFFLFFY